MNHTRVICMTACILALVMSVRAQQSDTTLKGKYERETLILDANGNKYVKNNQTKKVGFAGARIEKEFGMAGAESKRELAVYKKRHRRGTVMLVAGGVVFLSAAVLAPFVTLPVFLGSFCAGMITYDVGAIDMHQSRKHLSKAVWLRNRDALVQN